MRLKVPFFGYLLGIVGFLLPSVIFIAVLPSLINTEPVKARLMAELRDWAGGVVEVRGPVLIESFFSLSVELRDVEMGGVEGVAPITSVKAERIVARISWSDLLVGNFDFDKVRIYKAIVHARTNGNMPVGGVLLSVLAGAHKTPFAGLSVSDSVVIFDGDGQQPSRKLEVEGATASLRKSDGRIRVTGNLRWRDEPVVFRLTTNIPAPANPAAPVPMVLNVDSRLVSGSFNGETSLNGALNASGYLSLATSDLPALTEWSGWQREKGMPGVVQLTGSLDLASDWVSLQAAAFAVGGEKATGELTLRFNPQPGQLTGSLAFDDVDFAPFLDGLLGEPGAAADAQTMSRRLLSSLDMDLRISADTLRWDYAVATPAAFSLTAKHGVVSAEIAELGLYDGSVLGHVEADLTREPVRTRARLTAENIDTALMLQTVSDRSWLGGRAEAKVEIEAEGRGRAQLLQSAKAHARVSFPDGGTVPFDIPRMASAPPAQNVEGWSDVGLMTTAFDELRLQLTLQGGNLQWDELNLRSAGEVVRGSGSVDLARQQLDWRFLVRKATTGIERGEIARHDAAALPEASLSIQGPWARPTIRAGERSGALSAERPMRPARMGSAADPKWN